MQDVRVKVELFFAHLVLKRIFKYSRDTFLLIMRDKIFIQIHENQAVCLLTKTVSFLVAKMESLWTCTLIRAGSFSAYSSFTTCIVKFSAFKYIYKNQITRLHLLRT